MAYFNLTNALIPAFAAAIQLAQILQYINASILKIIKQNIKENFMKIIDLSVSLIPDNPSEVDLAKPKIEYVSHKTAVPSMMDLFPGTTADDYPGGNAWAFEQVTLQTHSGTHMDAPYHYGPVMDDGSKSRTIDEMPIDWYFHDGVMLDFSNHPAEVVLTVDDYKRELDRIGYTLKPFDIVLVQSGAAKYWKTAEYLVKGAGTGREATLWLTEQGIRVVGTDAWSWDRPLPLTSAEFTKTKDKNIIWEGHYAGLKNEYCHMEKLANLDKLPPFGFKVACFPVKVEKASGGWTRPVAIIE